MREAINEEAISDHQGLSMAIIEPTSGNHWQSMALTEASAQTSLAADWVVSEDVLVIISLISGTISAASSKPSSRSERLPETTLDGMAKLGS